MMTFEEIIQKLQEYWKNNNCTILPSFDLEVGAATLAPSTAMNILTDKNLSICQVQHCRRPLDGRFAKNPNRNSSYYQMQVILKPAPDNIQHLALLSLEEIGIKESEHDIRFIEDDWENPSIGASGLGYELWCDGMEILQFTYMQKIGGMECKIIAGEISYGLERVAMYSQNKNNVFDIIWSKSNNREIKYCEILSREKEIQFCDYYQNYKEDSEFLRQSFVHFEKQANLLLEKNLFHVAYEMALKASHTLNILDARRLLSHGERKEMILRIRVLAQRCFECSKCQ